VSYPRSNEPVEVSLVLFDISKRALLVGNTGNRDMAFWLPSSEVEYDGNAVTGWENVTVAGLPYMVRGATPSAPKRQDKAPIYTFIMPEWLANDRGLL
jgi:hypothetical protein